MIVRFMPHGQPLALKLLPALAVDLQSAVDAVRPAVVLKNSAHVMQHPHDGFTHRVGMVIRSCRCAPFLLFGVI